MTHGKSDEALDSEPLAPVDDHLTGINRDQLLLGVRLSTDSGKFVSLSFSHKSKTEFMCPPASGASHYRCTAMKKRTELR